MGNAGELTRALIQRVPGQSLIEKLLTEWDAGRVRLDPASGRVVIDDESRGWYWGVLGERHVGDILATLGRECTVLHSVPLGTADTDIDHVVIGPGGVVTLNTKYTPARKIWVAGHGLLVDGDRRPEYLRASMRERERVTDLLSQAAGFAVPVSSALVFVAPAHITQREPAGWDGVTIDVVSDRQLRGLLDRPREMSDAQLTRVLDAALHSETWHRSPRESAPGRHFAREFDALRAAVGPGLESTGRAPAAPSTRAPRRPAARVAPVRREASFGRRLGVGCLGLAVFAVAGWLLSQGFLAAVLSR